MWIIGAQNLSATGLLAVALLTLATPPPSLAENRYIILQSTTSTENSGLFDHILPAFSEETGIEVRVVAVGTGQALKNAKNGDGDVLMVHARSAEEQFVANGWGVSRQDVMYNDFILVGPPADPAAIRGSGDVTAALGRIAETHAPFASRGDDSGTHQKELALWAQSGVDVRSASGTWYRETGSGMGATLNAARGMDAYTLTDRATWISFENKGSHEILLEGDYRLFNQYGVILVNPARHAGVKADAGQVFIDWLTGLDGQAAIASFRLNGQQLFFPNADQHARH